MRITRAAASALAAVVVAALAPIAIASPAAQAAISQPSIVSANPADETPYVLNGSVKAIVQVGDKVIVGGTFTQVKEFGGTKPTLVRNNLFAFSASTNLIDPSFVPNANGLVASLALSADGQSVYVGGQFTTIDGVGPRSIARLNVSNGARTAGFNPPTYNSQITDLKLHGNVLYTAGAFSYVGATARSSLATLNATSGALTNSTSLVFAGTHNGGTTQILKIDVTPAGDRLIAIGNFKTVDGVTRDQFAMLNITPTTTTLGWYTPFYQGTCSNSFNSYMRDVDFSPDGAFFVITTTGAYGGATSSCDVTARFETYTSSGETVGTTWRNYTGGDTTYAVAITGTVVYVGGHARWQNNPNAGDRAGTGAVPRPGIAALDPVNGLPFSWNPTRDTGVGVFDFLVTPTGLWAGSDTSNIGGEYHPRLAFFPLAGGTAVPAGLTGSVPNDVYLTGRTANAPKPSVLYRINAGGPALASEDNGPGWAADTASSSPYRNTGSTASSNAVIPSVTAAVPNSNADRAPVALFSTYRYDPSGGNEMTWNFPVPAGAQVQVRTYLANRCTCTSAVGQRVFNLDLDGTRVLNNYDIVADVGHNVGTMKSWDVTSTGTINLTFRHVTENPLVNGIEIIRTDLPPTPNLFKSDVQRRYFTGTAADPTVVLSDTGPDWSAARGSMLIDGTVYYATTGKLNAVSFDGTTFGTPSEVNLYTGTFGNEATNVTGMFFTGGRMYFTLAGDNTLHYRYFTPESRIVGATRYDATGDMSAFAGSRVSGMFLSGGRVYFADSTTGALQSMAFASNVLTGPVSVADSTQDWRARGMFVWNGVPKPRVGAPPVAVVNFTCEFLECEFDGTDSTDADGSVVSYAWNFGDTATSTSPTPVHEFATPGTYNVTLTVTDDAGQTGVHTVPVTVDLPPNQLPTAESTVQCSFLVCSVDSGGSTDPDGSVVGYGWDFGEGAGATTPVASHTYSAAGTYDIVLTVTDNRGGTAQKSTTVTVAPNQAPTAVLDVTCTYLACTTSSAGSSDPDGPLASYLWDFGDGATSADAEPPHTYLDGGTYLVTLTVADQQGLTTSATQEVTVAPAPNVPPVSVPEVSCTYLVCTYDGTDSTDSDGTVVSHLWDFGNGTTSTDAAGSYTFPADGSYTIALTVTDNDGAPHTASVPVTVAARVNVAPVSVPEVSCTYLVCTYDGTDSTDSDGTVVSHLWDFGNGTTSTDAAGSYTFPADGSYTIALTVTDNDGAPHTASVPVTVAARVNVAPVSVPEVSCTYLVCTYDGTDSTDSDGTVVSHLWDFGNGTTSTDAAGSYTFPADGSYTIALTVTDNDGAPHTASVPVTVAARVNVAPVSVPEVSCTYLVCTYDGTDSTDSDGTVVSHLWDFGNGTTSTDAAGSYTFPADGSYTIALTVTDNDGAPHTASVPVTVAARVNVAPVSVPEVSCTYLVCTYDGTDSTDSDGTVVSHLWDFGNGTTSTSAAGSYTYPAGGSYTIALTVTDNDGAPHTASVPVTVAPLVSPIAFVGARSIQANSTTASLQAPAATQSGNAMLLFVTTNTTATVTSLSGGWTLVGERLAGDTTPDLRTRLYSKVATPTDAGATSSLVLAGQSKMVLSMLVYSGTDTTSPIASWASAKETATTAVHTAPSVVAADGRSWAVSYFADKANSAPGWQTPAGSTLRAADLNTGSGRISSLAVDGATHVAAGPVAGLAATAGASTYKATMWTVLLRPTP